MEIKPPENGHEPMEVNTGMTAPSEHRGAMEEDSLQNQPQAMPVDPSSSLISSFTGHYSTLAHAPRGPKSRRTAGGSPIPAKPLALNKEQRPLRRLLRRLLRWGLAVGPRQCNERRRCGPLETVGDGQRPWRPPNISGDHGSFGDSPASPPRLMGRGHGPSRVHVHSELSAWLPKAITNSFIKAMAATKLFALLLQGFILFSVKVHEKLDEAAWKRMEEREKEMNREMTRLMEEMERRSQPQWSLVPTILQQRPQEQSITTWGAVLFAAIAGVLVLLFWLCWWLRTRRRKTDSVRSTSEISISSTVEGDEKETDAEDRSFAILSSHDRHLQWPVQKIISRSEVVKGLVDELLQVLRIHLSSTFMPVLQEAIGVGSSFEGWSPYEVDKVMYHILVPLKAPTGHKFWLQPLCGRCQIPAMVSHIHVELECSCGGQNSLCFLHSTKKQLRRIKKAPKVLDILCTRSYLDAAKVAEWFQDLVKKAWTALPRSHYKVNVLPYSQTTCLLQLKSDSGSSLIVEILFGVQQGDSDIFLSSLPAADSPSTVWTTNYLVAEKKFFSHMAKQVPQGSFHFKCLHLCTSILEGTDISLYMLKTVVMHLLNTTPVSGWCRQDCIIRLADIMNYLHRCLEQKQLNFFFFGNAEMPKEIILPPDFQTYKPANLLEHLVQDQAAHTKALRQFEEIQHRLMERLYQGVSKTRRASRVMQRAVPPTGIKWLPPVGPSRITTSGAFYPLSHRNFYCCAPILLTPNMLGRGGSGKAK
ncbi:inositol 1,4,5-trisphosphate receptor-interacting protein-like 1 [Dryobates pubescens]|uniref:inositol 1,4,5-trisphosphate receptor-interacting protein-like 1 n=1 Tax=Dryobates pubescens TaxID=118200 RepID=UPI0023B95283|nr:inositol 1,4,5-trisphosphate receptor-interacting protein-like 1 [Dryobates pubescens]